MTTNPMMVEQRQADVLPHRAHNQAFYRPPKEGEVPGGPCHWVWPSIYTRAHRTSLLAASLMVIAALAGAAVIAGREDRLA